MPKPDLPSAAAALNPLQLRRILSEPEFFRLIFDALPLQVVVKSTRPDTFGQFLLWNRVAEEWLGLRAEETIGRTDHDFFPKEQAEFFLEKDREVVRTRQAVDIPEEVIESRTHGARYIHTVKTPIFDEENLPLALLAVSEDVTDRRRTADELDSTLRLMRDERDLFRALLNHLPVCAFAKSARSEDFGTYVLWNRVMEEMHGKEAGEVLGRGTEEVFDARTAETFARQDRQVIEEQRLLNIPVQAVNYGRVGRRLVRSLKAPVFDADGSPLAIIGVAEDITERMHHDAERTQAIEMLSELNRRVPGAIYKLKVQPDGRRAFTYLSERIEEIYGISATELLANYDLTRRCVHPEDVEQMERAEEHALRDGTVFNCEFRIHTRKNGMRWVHSTASRQPVEDGGSVWSGFVMDITERKQAEEALRESEERWELALAGTEAGVWDWNVRTGQVFYSQRWQQMFEYGGQELPRTPHDLLQLIHPDDRALVRNRTLDLLRRKTELFRCEYRMQRQDGSYLWILAHAKAHFDRENRATRMIGTLIDITERKRVERQLVEAKIAAENASRAKGDFLAMMSHEIRTPLNGVLGFAELLAGTPLDAHQSEYLQTIRDSGSNLLHVLNDILDYSKIESGKLAIDSQPTVLRELAESSLEMFRAAAEAKQLQLKCEIADGTPEIVVVDGLRLRQVLTNLISNAVKFTDAGSVRLRVEPTGAVEKARQPLRFTISDTGIGIPSEDLPRLFEPFQQLDVSMARRFGGTGLGLSIVRRLVGMMGGEISATSSPGTGTIFTIELTLALDGVVGGKSKAAPPRGNAANGAVSLLLVEDHPVNRRLAKLMLERLGYSPDEATDGAHAVDLSAAKTYDVILMDIQMPGMDGYEAARRIHERSPYSQIIALTAHALPADRERSLAAGMNHHLTKPVRIDELRDVLATCVAEASRRGPGR
jgi:PAS domain S-box-containing protein